MLLELKLKRIRLKEQKNLNRTNYLLFKSMTSYIKNSDLREIEKEEVLQQIMDMLLQAQAEDKSIDLFIGNDYEVFCDDIIKEYERDKPKAYLWANYLQKGLLYFLITIIIMAGFNWIIPEKRELSISLRDLIIAFSIAFIIIPYSRKNIKETTSVVYSKRIVIRKGLGGIFSFFTWLIIFLPMMIMNTIEKVYGTNIFGFKINIYENLTYYVIILSIILCLSLFKQSILKNQN